MDIQSLFSYATQGLVVVGLIAFVVSIITQVTKSWGFLNKIPTALQVYVTSAIVTIAALIAYCQIKSYSIQWYYVFGAIIGSFIISLVATNGWDAVKDIYTKCKYPQDK